MLKIILADNQAIFRAGIAKVLAVEDDIRIVAQAQSLEQMMNALETFQGSILLFSSSLAPGLEQVITLASASNTRVIVIAETGEQTERYVRSGIQGIAFRSITGDDLLRCVRAVAHGERYLHDVRSAPLSDDEDCVGARVRDRLTPKELKIVALIVQGYKNKEIATQLGTTEQVVKNYLRNVYDKIGVSDRLELALFTIHHRILAEAAAATAAAMASAASAAGTGTAAAS